MRIKHCSEDTAWTAHVTHKRFVCHTPKMDMTIAVFLQACMCVKFVYEDLSLHEDDLAMSYQTHCFDIMLHLPQHSCCEYQVVLRLGLALCR